MTAIAASETTYFQFIDALKSFVRSLRITIDRHAQRRAIAELLAMDAVRLDDLGLNAGDIRDALQRPAPAGSRLHASRATRALSWSPKSTFAG